MTRHYSDLGSASDWLNQISHAARPIRSTTQIWVVTRHQYGISALVPQTSFCWETSSGIANCRLFSSRSAHRCMTSLVSLGDVTANDRVQYWPGRERLGTTLVYDCKVQLLAKSVCKLGVTGKNSFFSMDRRLAILSVPNLNKKLSSTFNDRHD